MLQIHAFCPHCGAALVLAPKGEERTDLRDAKELTPHRLTCNRPPTHRRSTRTEQEHEDSCPRCGTIGPCKEVSDRFGAVHTCLSCDERRYTPLLRTRKGAMKGRLW